MQNFARIAAGTVAEIVTIQPDEPPLAERYHPDLLAQFVPVTDAAVAQGWLFDGAAFSAPPPPPLSDAQAERLAAVRAALAARIAAGMTWQGKVLQIDEESCALLTSADAMAAAGGLPDNFSWRMADNSFLALDAPGLRAMALAAGQYVYALKVTSWAMADAIRAAPDLAAVAAVDPEAGWPGEEAR